MQSLCAVDVSRLLPLLGSLTWSPSGANDGTYGMIAYSNLPVPVQREVDRIVALVLPKDYRRGIAYMARLVPGQRVPPHVDREDEECPERVHVPLLSNPEAVFSTGGKDYLMPVGAAYRIDPTQEHAAYNGGTTDRVHLFFNMVWCGQSESG